MERVARIGVGTSKRVSQVRGVDAPGRPVLRRKLFLRRKLSREAGLASFKGLAPAVAAPGHCGARPLRRLRRAGRRTIVALGVAGQPR